MRRNPYRPDAAVTQPFNDGIVSISRTQRSGQAGSLPVRHLVRKVVLPYAERRMGIARYYDAMQAQTRVDRVIRVPDPGEITVYDGKIPIHGPINSQDVAVTEDGRQYEIDMVQSVPDVFPKCLDITLRAIEPIYEEQGVQSP